MKKWMGMLLFTGIGVGLGFFAGERLGERKKKKEIETNVERNAEEQLKAVVDDYISAIANRIAVENGYEDDDQDVQATEEYLAQFEHPEEEKDDEDIYEDEKHVDDTAVQRTPDESYISLCDEEDWDNEYDFEKIELFYYEEDEIVCDEDEKRIDDPEDMIGHETLNTFGSIPTNPYDVIYVRNTFTETMYQITRIHNAYGRVVLGIDDDPDVESHYPIN